MKTDIIEDLLKQRILILDGAMGTMIQNADLSANDFGGEEFEGCNEYLNSTKPSVIQHIHESYLEAGADIIQTNTFGAASIVLDEYNLGHLAYELNKQAVLIAKKAIDQYSTFVKPRFVAGSMGPTTKTLSVTGGTTFDRLSDSYHEQALGLLDGGVDLLLIETSQDMLNVKAAHNGIQRAFQKTNKQVPIIISGTIEPMGTTLAGQGIEAFYISCMHMNPLAVGLNCATGPEFMAEHLRSLSDISSTAVSCYPNAGLPDEEGHYNETPALIAGKIKQFAEKGWVNIVGGCCGTTPSHIKAIAEAIADVEPRVIQTNNSIHMISGIEPLQYDESMRPLLVGERTNVIGSRKFKGLIKEGKFEEGAEIARQQVKKGAHVIDICLADPDDDEIGNMEKFITEAAKKVKVPFVIDSTDEAVIEKALKYTQGKAIINSINLEDGEERFEKIVPLAKLYGAALVVGTIDEEGMGVDANRKLDIAQRSYQLLTEKYQIAPEDIIFDPLVFPVGTGDIQYTEAAAATVDGLKLIKKAFPLSLTILGISNVSFGLPTAGREVLNAVFLYHCTKAGLDYAIVNTENLQRYASIPQDEISMSDELLFANSDKALAKFVAFYRTKKPTKQANIIKLPLKERLAGYIVEGTKEGLASDLQEALENGEKPLSIINGPLMAGMAEVGRLFNDNQLIVAEVLQSAEAMKAAVSFLEPHMEKGSTSASKGKMVLATVKGDVHDIGKNLVDIILTNNGYQVVDLGIKVTPQTIIEAVRREKPTMIGLSGLLVKSAQQMVLTAQDLQQAGIDVPILVGGAALTRRFTDTKIVPEYEGTVLYSKDAMYGLELANILHDDHKRKEYLRTLKRVEPATSLEKQADPSSEQSRPKSRRSAVQGQRKIPIPIDVKKHVIRQFSIKQIYPYINKQMLFGHHLGLKGNIDKMIVNNNSNAIELTSIVETMLNEEDFHLSAIYQFFPAKRNGDSILIYDPKDDTKVLETFDFPRQQQSPFLCLADYLVEHTSADMDYIGLMIVTAGKGIRQKAEQWKNSGEYVKSHVIQALALESAEGLAERVHHMMRDAWNIPDSVEMTMKERFSAKYTGQRYSFGYPACPNLEDQAKLFKLLQPEEIGIELTEGFMMEPEASVSAIVFSHPDARYFNVEK